MKAYSSDEDFRQKSQSSNEPDIKTLKLEVIEKILKISNEKLLIQATIYFQEITAPDYSEHTEMSQVREPIAGYGKSQDMETMKLFIIGQILQKREQSYLSRFLHYINDLTERETDQSLSLKIDESLEDARQGRIYKAKDTEDMFQQILGE